MSSRYHCISNCLSILWLFIFFVNVNALETDDNGDNWGITRINVKKVKYSWTITDYSLNGLGFNEYLESPIFSGDDSGKYQWQLKLYPKGDREEAKDWVSLFVSLKNQKNVTVTYEFYLIDGSGKKMNSYSSTQIFNGLSWGWPKFIENSKLQDKTNNLLLNDSLTIFAEMSMKEGITNISGGCGFKNNVSKTDHIAIFLENSFLSDVQVRVDGQEIKAHRAILASHSSWFMQEFTKNPNLDAVYIENTTVAAAKQALRFMYTGKIEMNDTTPEELLSLSNQLEIPQLKLLCEEVLCKSMTSINAVHTLMLAELHNAKNLGREASNYIAAHAASVADSPGFKELEQSYPNPFYGILRTIVNKGKA